MTLGLLAVVLLHRPGSSTTVLVGAIHAGIARRIVEPIRGQTIEALRVPVPVVEACHARRLDVSVRADARFAVLPDAIFANVPEADLALWLLGGTPFPGILVQDRLLLLFVDEQPRSVRGRPLQVSAGPIASQSHSAPARVDIHLHH